MDQGRARSLLLISAALALSADRTAPIPIREFRWLAAGAPLDRLSRLPTECFKPPADLAERRSAAIGRIAFRAPLLLGGQAARVGLSCSSCHRNGRGNPDFHFPGISGAAGTADVTASLLSSHRGDDIFNPKPIPDLAGDTAKRIVTRDPGKPALKIFIRGLIMQEFDGAEPPPTVLDGITAYVRSIGPQNCKPGDVPLKVSLLTADIDSALELARTERDPATAGLLIGAARSNLGRIDERYQVPGLEADRSLLVAADAELRRLQEALGSASQARLWRAWNSTWPARRKRLEADQSRSLFAQAVLAKFSRD